MDASSGHLVSYYGRTSQVKKRGAPCIFRWIDGKNIRLSAPTNNEWQAESGSHLMSQRCQRLAPNPPPIPSDCWTADVVDAAGGGGGGAAG